MTNEEIYKYADKKLQKQENRVLLSTLVPLALGIIGMSPIFYVLDSLNNSVIIEGFIIAEMSILVMMFLLVINIWNKWFKFRRNYTYNLVRKDERQRIASEELFGR